MTKLGFIGAGNMGFALLIGFSVAIAESKRRVGIYIYDADPLKREKLKSAGYNICEDELEIAENCKYILIACKPQHVKDLLHNIKPALTPESVIVSLCAGISADYIRKITGEDTKVILVMPNMPVLLGAGASAMACDGAVSREEFDFVRGIIESCGTSEVIPMSKMNEIICINASSPAFIYMFAQSFAEYAAKQGINERAALNLFAKTLIGSAKMILETDSSIAELIAQVSSKEGTTAAGIQALYDYGLQDVVEKACEACTKRAYELGESH